MAARMIYRLPRTRLQQFIIAELCAFGGGVALSLELYFWVLSSPWMIVLAVVCAAHCVSLGAALFWRGAHQRKVTVVCVGNWTSALLITFVAPVMLPVMVLQAMLPVLFAERYVRGRRLKTLILITAGCALALGGVARLQDASGIPDLIPDSVVTFRDTHNAADHGRTDPVDRVVQRRCTARDRKGRESHGGRAASISRVARRARRAASGLSGSAYHRG